jgi:hypothetical protein
MKKYYTFYKVIETNEGIEKDINDILYTTSIEEVKKAYQYINDTMQYDKRFKIEVICDLLLSDEVLKDIDDLLLYIYVYEAKKKINALEVKAL